jgi:hypothetical protein
MSIERLNKAATAAGFAMATPDDEAAPETPAEHEATSAPSRAIVVPDQPTRLLSTDAASSVSTWLKGYLSGFGWRQPA